MRIFDRPIREGMPLSFRGLVEGLRRMARAWETLSVHNGHVDWHAGKPKIIFDAAGPYEPGTGDGLPAAEKNKVLIGSSANKWEVGFVRFHS